MHVCMSQIRLTYEALFAFCTIHSICLLLTWTSSSLRIGMRRTLYFCLNSLDNGADINFRRMWEGAEKCRLRFLLRSDVTCLLNFILLFWGLSLERKAWNTRNQWIIPQLNAKSIFQYKIWNPYAAICSTIWNEVCIRKHCVCNAYGIEKKVRLTAHEHTFKCT